MKAETLRCPSCGAAVSSAATRCDFCKAVLATVTCPSCFQTMFAGAKFCSHCGAKGNRTELAAGEARLCPRCQIGMKTVAVGNSNLLECSQCEGIWVDVETLQQICTDREKQAFVSSVPPSIDQPLQFETAIRYVPCPICHELMNRVQFAHCSHIVVDVCKPHGTWFDKDELQRAVQFVQAGGLEKARTDQLAEIKDEQRKLEASRLYAPFFDPSPSRTGDDPRVNSATSAIGLLFDLFR
jgi:Zn-finger nucleic acid-binding protein